MAGSLARLSASNGNTIELDRVRPSAAGHAPADRDCVRMRSAMRANGANALNLQMDAGIDPRNAARRDLRLATMTVDRSREL